MLTDYLTLERESGPSQIKEKSSKFIAYSYIAGDKDQAEKIIHDLRKRYHDATHVCYAYRLGEGTEKYFRYNDDGEPSGTAGIPIFNEIKRRNLYNVLIAVVRYFGGVKLGTGGLARAYASAAREVLDSSRIIQKQIVRKLSVSIPYDFIGELMGLVNQMKMTIISQSYAQEAVKIKIAAPVANYESFITALTDKSGGKVKIEQD
jgi:uncharacterized YigZ family protein